MSVVFGVEEKTLPNKVSTTGHTNVESSSSSVCAKIDGTISEEKEDHKVIDLARKFTSQSAQHDLGSPFDAVEGGGLDPKSDQFRAKSWARAFYDLRYGSEEALPRVAGAAFKNLNVWGKGSPTDFQSTVGNKILKLPALFGRGSQKIDILRNLDGLLLPGEQLCVLGPPGSVLVPILHFRG
jgi:ATP-binding cassette subfamily G (WHITE) protein 2 (PDR)